MSAYRDAALELKEGGMERRSLGGNCITRRQGSIKEISISIYIYI